MFQRRWCAQAAWAVCAVMAAISAPQAANGDACCLSNGTCTDVVDQAACGSLGGCWQGTGTLCAGLGAPGPWYCPPRDNVNTGGCLDTTGNCIGVFTEFDCECLNGAPFDPLNFRHWLGAGTTCADTKKVNFERGNGSCRGGQLNISGATLFAPYFQAIASNNDWINPDNDKVPCSGDAFNQFKDTNCNGSVDFVGGDRADTLGRSYVCGQNWWGYWLVQYRSVGSVNGYNEFIENQLTGRLPNSVPSELGVINNCQWATTGSKTGPCAGCEDYFLSKAGSGDLNCDCKVDARDLQIFVNRLAGAPFVPCPPQDCPNYTTLMTMTENADFDGIAGVGVGDVPGFVQFLLSGGTVYQNESTSGQTGTPVRPDGVDLAFLDVPAKWGTRANGGAPAFSKRPNQPGYGLNPVPSCTGLISNLADLSRSKKDGPPVSLNFNQANPDGNTLYDTSVAFVPVVPIATQGTAKENVRFTELRHLLITGRLPNGENLVGVTRDVGSGTRNAHNNSLGVDPSWGMGENDGDLIRAENPVAFNPANPSAIVAPNAFLGYVRLGTAGSGAPLVYHVSANCEGSGIMERVTQNRRLGIGYTGLFGSGRAIDDAIAFNYEILNTCKDIDGDGDGFVDSDCTGSPCDGGSYPSGGCNGGIPPFSPPGNNTLANTGFVRPTVDSVIDNGDPRCSYTIGGFGSFVSRGDPESGRGGNTNPGIANCRARDYLRNIKDSISAFVLNPTLPSNQLSPAQFLATRFTLLQGVDRSQDPNIPTKFNANAGFVQSLQDVIRCTTTQVTPAFGASCANRVPRRVNQLTVGFGPAYSDGSLDGKYKYRSGGADQTIGDSNSLNLNDRNEVMGDFDVSAGQKKKRNVNDIDEMMLALCAPRNFERDVDHGGCRGSLLSDHVIPEVIGDFTGDGNFDARDIRYFADGLALTDSATPTLDRASGFTLVDNGWAATSCGAGNINFFGTRLRTRKVYVAGDSRGDVAGNMPCPGANAEGANGCIDATDIDYVLQNRFTGSWSTLSDALIDLANNRRKDLSCDMNGDLLVNQGDVDVLVQTILCTQYGDRDLDGDVDAGDLAGMAAIGATPVGWASGDFDGDRIITANDVAICNAHQGFVSSCSLTGPACP